MPCIFLPFFLTFSVFSFSIFACDHSRKGIVLKKKKKNQLELTMCFRGQSGFFVFLDMVIAKYVVK